MSGKNPLGVLNRSGTNIWQIKKEAQDMYEAALVQRPSEVPPGITKLDEALDISRKMHKGKYTYEEAKELVHDPDFVGFQWLPFSEKQTEVIDLATEGCPYWILLLEGAVRSGKTIATNAAWLKFVQNSKFPFHLLTGKTRDTMYRNILSNIFDILGEDYYHFNRSEGILTFMGKTIWCLGANDERSESRFRGPTVGSWYGDEVTTYPESVMKMAVSRASVDDAIILWTTNPDSPYHPVYTDYLANEKMIENQTIKTFHFDLADNLTLSKRYVTNLKSSYSGLWYDRFIKGLWTIAEGAVYDMFVESKHTFEVADQPYEVYDDYTVGIDYATSSVCCYTLMGVHNNKGYNEYHFLDEWYYDAKAKRKQLSDGEYAEKLAEFVGDNDHPVSRVFVPHDAASLTIELRKAGFVVAVVVPDVVTELKIIGNMLRNGHILTSHKCENLIKQFMTYVWDQRAQTMGVDAPLKQDDHAVDSMRYNIIGYISAPRIPDPKLIVPGPPCY